MNPFLTCLFRSCFYLAVTALLFAVTPASAQTMTREDSVKSAAGYNTITWFPFEVNEATRTVRVDMESPRIVNYYTTLFKKYLYAGNSKTWDDMVEELLAQKDIDFSVKNTLDYNSTETFFVVTAGNRADLDRLLAIVKPVFASLPKLEAFIKTVEPSHIADGSHQPEAEGE